MEVTIEKVFGEVFNVAVVEHNDHIETRDGRVKGHVNVVIESVDNLGPNPLEITRYYRLFFIVRVVRVIDVFVFRMIEVCEKW